MILKSILSSKIYSNILKNSCIVEYIVNLCYTLYVVSWITFLKPHIFHVNSFLILYCPKNNPICLLLIRLLIAQQKSSTFGDKTNMPYFLYSTFTAPFALCQKKTK